VKPEAFDYVAAESVAEAVRALAATPGARVIAGGQSLVPLLCQRSVRAPLLVDVCRVHDIGSIERAGDMLRLGATTRLRTLERHPDVFAGAPVLAEAAGLVGPVHVRNRATLAGSLAHADPAAEVPAALVASGASVRVVGPAGPRTVDAADFAAGAHRTVLGSAEVVVGVDVPLRPGSVGGAFREFSTRPGDLPLVGVGCALEFADSGACTSVSMVACGVADRPVRLTAGAAVVGLDVLSADVLRAVATGVAAELEPRSDRAASADYRRELAEVLAVDAIVAAWRSVTAA
jgi:carbon-monoxide dehydrogenase medium subunit